MHGLAASSVGNDQEARFRTVLSLAEAAILLYRTTRSPGSTVSDIWISPGRQVLSSQGCGGP
jgi:hypothetical protein